MKRALFALMCALFLITGCSATLDMTVEMAESPSPEPTPTPESLDYLTQPGEDAFGQTEAVFDYGDERNISVLYPKSGLLDVDGVIKGFIDETIDGFEKEAKNKTADLHIDYDSYLPNPVTASVVFYIDKTINGKKTEAVKTYMFDLASQERMGLEDVFTGDYLNALYGKALAELNEDPAIKKYVDKGRLDLKKTLKPNFDSFENLVITGDNALVFFQSGFFHKDIGLTSIKMPMAGMSGIIKIDAQPTSAAAFTVDGADSPVPAPSPHITHTVNSQAPMVAITFDDGPHGVVTNELLDIFHENGAHATFSIVGSRVSMHETVIRRILHEGNEIANHTWSHVRLEGLSKIQVMEEITKTNNVISDVTGGYVPYFIRPPYGSTDKTVEAAAKELGMAIATWSVDTRDWSYRNADKVYEECMKAVKDGYVVLCHDMYPSTVDAMKRVVPDLIKQGYQVVTLSNLFSAAESFPEPGKLVKKVQKPEG